MNYNNNWAVGIVVFCIVLAVVPAAGRGEDVTANKAPLLSPGALIDELKKGGYIIYFRHGITGREGEKEVDRENITNCRIQRNLTSTGIEQTRLMGKAIKKHGIPIGEVLSSPYCRCMDTARNLFGRAQPSDILFFAINVTKTQRAEITTQLRGLLSTLPQEGVNTVLVSHTANLREATGIWPKPEGVAHVFKPIGEGGFVYIGEIPPDGWEMTGLNR
ncbi:histidine phosphatase family protein [Porticoccus sp.]